MTDTKDVPKKGSLLKKLGLAIVGVIGLFMVLVAMQPASWSVTRSAVIAAPASQVFPLVNDLKQWEKWSPWEKMDPAMKRTYEGPASGTGAAYGWVGNNEVGEGRMTITESKPDELVKMNLHFLKPFEDSCVVDFTFKQEGTQTRVGWTMAGQKNFMQKAICMFMDMDKMLGGQFETGLASMKTAAESPKK